MTQAQLDQLKAGRRPEQLKAAQAATVCQIADQAEFTPRTVQTSQYSVTTVYAIKSPIDNADGELRPGMPADVAFKE